MQRLACVRVRAQARFEPCLYQKCKCSTRAAARSGVSIWSVASINAKTLDAILVQAHSRTGPKTAAPRSQPSNPNKRVFRSGSNPWRAPGLTDFTSIDVFRVARWIPSRRLPAGVSSEQPQRASGRVRCRRLGEDRPPTPTTRPNNNKPRRDT